MIFKMLNAYIHYILLLTPWFFIECLSNMGFGVYRSLSLCKLFEVVCMLLLMLGFWGIFTPLIACKFDLGLLFPESN